MYYLLRSSCGELSRNGQWRTAVKLDYINMETLFDSGDLKELWEEDMDSVSAGIDYNLIGLD